MKEGINVLSLFDGMSCGQIALDKLGVKVSKYFACEIDKYAMQVTQHNFPDTIQLGDVQFVTKETFGNHRIDLVIGGSPCQGFSFAGKMLNFDDPRSKLFFEFVRLVKDLKPKYFLLENVKMKQESKDIITEYMGVEPIEINSALVSAQTRKRLYWTNIPNVGQPEDKGIVLKDIIEDGMAGEAPVKHTDRNRRHLKDVNGKSLCASATMYKGAGNNGMTLIQVDDKLRHPEATKKGYAEAGEGEGLDLTFPQSKTRRGRSMKDKSNCLTAAGHEMGVVEKVLTWRKLTPLECERLQTVPDKVFFVNFEICIDQAKNFVSAVRKNPKLQKLVLNAEKEGLLEHVKFAEKNTKQKNQKTKSIALQNVGTLTQKQIKECIKTSLKGLNINAKDVENYATSRSLKTEGGSVDLNVSTIITEGKIVMHGRGESHLKDNLLLRVKSGKNALSISGKEMTLLAEDAVKGLNTKGVRNSTSIISSLFSTKSIEQMLITYYLFAENVICGYTQKETIKENTYLPLIVIEGYTSVVSDSQRYKMLGNGWTVDVITHIMKNMEL